MFLIFGKLNFNFLQISGLSLATSHEDLAVLYLATIQALAVIFQIYI